MKTGIKSGFLKTGVLLASIAAIGVGSSMALLSASSPQVENSFESAKINISILESNGKDEFSSDVTRQEDFTLNAEGKTIKRVKVQNLNTPEYPTTDTFVRVALVPVIRDNADPDKSYGGEISLMYTPDESTGWVYDAQSGYYYYTKVLVEDDITPELFQAVEVVPSETAAGNASGTVTLVCGDLPEGAHIELQVLADAIQARPYETVGGVDTPVQSAWGWSYDTNDSTLKKQNK